MTKREVERDYGKITERERDYGKKEDDEEDRRLCKRMDRVIKRERYIFEITPSHMDCPQSISLSMYGPLHSLAESTIFRNHPFTHMDCSQSISLIVNLWKKLRRERESQEVNVKKEKTERRTLQQTEIVRETAPNPCRTPFSVSRPCVQLRKHKKEKKAKNTKRKRKYRILSRTRRFTAPRRRSRSL